MVVQGAQRVDAGHMEGARGGGAGCRRKHDLDTDLQKWTAIC